jgi:dTDP-glucose 4,6-dehydratase
LLVTGAGGFIGSHLLELAVEAGATVRGFVRYTSRNDYGWLEALPSDIRDEVDVFRGDIVNPEAVANAVAGCDVVLHLGALIPIPYSYRHPREFAAANVEGTLNVLEACRRQGIDRLVVTSTSEVYGTPETVPIAETHPLNAQSPYAASKIGADQLALSYRASFDLPVVVARPFNTFGPRQSARAVIPTVVSQALLGSTVTIGSTSPTRDFVFVKDTAAGILLCGMARGIEGEVINLGSGVETSIGSIIELVGAALGRDLDVVIDAERVRPAGSEIPRLVSDSRKAAELLGWRAETPFGDGIERTIEWFGEWQNAYKPLLYNL